MEYIDPVELEKILDETINERDMLSLIKNHPRLLYWSFCKTSGHCRYVFSEFPLGSRYKVDFVVLNSYSGVWEVMFIELEPVGDAIFNKLNKPSERFSGAIKQIDDWIEYYEEHKNQVRSDLVKWAKSRDILGYDSDDEPVNYSGDRLSDTSSFLNESFHIIVGRRKKTSKNGHRRKATYNSRHNINVRTYDMLLDTAKDRYADRRQWVD